MEGLIAFQAFPTAEDAAYVAAILQNHAIVTEIAMLSPRLDTLIIGDDYINKYELRILPSDFSKARKVLLENAKANINDISTDHPLYSMTNEELQEVVDKPDEWGAENYNIALAILEQRQIQVSIGESVHPEHGHADENFERKDIGSFLITIGYLMPVIALILNIVTYNNHKIYWYFPGLLSIIISLVILRSKTTLTDGSQINTYSVSNIKHGSRIFVLNLVSWIGIFLWMMFTMA
jgi:hypothetical protein